MRAFHALSSTGMTLKTVTAEANEMIREHEIPAWHWFCLKVAVLVVAVGWVSYEFCWGVA